MGTAVTHHVDTLGIVRRLGRKPPASRQPLMRAVPLVPEAQWQQFKAQPYDYYPADVPFLDQGTYGACNPHATITGMHIIRSLNGMPAVRLSPWYVYANLCQGVDEGSSISDALKWITSHGTSLDMDVPYGTIDPRRIPPLADIDAPRFRAELAGACTTFPEIISSVLRDEPVNLSLRAGVNFSNLDPEGVVGYESGDGNHAVCAFGGLKWSARWGWLVKIINSWTQQWGLGGCAWVSEQHTVKSGWFEAYALRSVTDDPTDKTVVPAPAPA